MTSLLPKLLRRLGRRPGAAAGPDAMTRLAEYARRSGAGNVLRLLHIVERMYGHERSAQEGRPVCGRHQPLPWYTYPAIDYLRGLDLRGKSVFEFGAGYGSRFFAQRARRVVSIDHDPRWVAEITATPHANLTIHLREDKDRYVHSIRDFAATWDVIAIDGVWRRACAETALEHLSPTGLIILDNADWYPRTAQRLRQADLLQIDFTGLGPVNYYTWTTSFFLRRNVDLIHIANPVPAPGSLTQTGGDDVEWSPSAFPIVALVDNKGRQ